ncbi:MAG: hypothetical protein WA993_19405 [Candidatus Binatus sp.]|jgi:hypothetical protein
MAKREFPEFVYIRRLENSPTSHYFDASERAEDALTIEVQEIAVYRLDRTVKAQLVPNKVI